MRGRVAARAWGAALAAASAGCLAGAGDATQFEELKSGGISASQMWCIDAAGNNVDSVGTDTCQMCGHDDFTLSPGETHVTTVNLTGCSVNVGNATFSLCRIIRGGSFLSCLPLEGYSLSVANAATGAPFSSAPETSATDYFSHFYYDLPDPIMLNLIAHRDATSKGPSESLLLGYSAKARRY